MEGMKNNKWMLFLLLLLMGIAWGIYYWMFIVPSQ